MSKITDEPQNVWVSTGNGGSAYVTLTDYIKTNTEERAAERRTDRIVDTIKGSAFLLVAMFLFLIGVISIPIQVPCFFVGLCFFATGIGFMTKKSLK